MTYCIEVDRSALPEENLTLHYDFETEPSRDDIVEFLLNEDIGFSEEWCGFNYYPV